MHTPVYVHVSDQARTCAVCFEQNLISMSKRVRLVHSTRSLTSAFIQDQLVFKAGFFLQQYGSPLQSVQLLSSLQHLRIQQTSDALTSPYIISYKTTPKHHQSTARSYSCFRSTSGAKYLQTQDNNTSQTNSALPRKICVYFWCATKCCRCHAWFNSFFTKTKISQTNMSLQ